MPSHFDSNGDVNGTMGKSAFVGFNVLLQCLFLLGFPLLGKMLNRMPESTINIPNSGYWLAPERKEETMSKLSGLLIACGWLSGMLLIVMFHLTALVAVESRRGINPEFMWALGLYLFAILVVVSVSIWQFRLPAGAQHASIQATNADV